MPSRDKSDAKGNKQLPNSETSGFVKKSEPETVDKAGFQSDIALAIVEELYPLLLENCTDEDDEVDAQAVFETLAGLMGLFVADYSENYGQEKAMAAFKDLSELALLIYQERSEQTAD